MTIHIPFFSINWYKPMAEWLRLMVDRLVIWVRFPHGAESFCRTAAILRGVSAQTRALFILLCPLFFFLSWISSVAISHWQGLTFNMNIRLPRFWSTWSPAWGPDSATWSGLAHKRDYSYCRASALKLQKCLALVFPWIVENTLNNGLRWGFFNPHPPDWSAQIRIEQRSDFG